MGRAAPLETGLSDKQETTMPRVPRARHVRFKNRPGIGSAVALALAAGLATSSRAWSADKPPEQLGPQPGDVYREYVKVVGTRFPAFGVFDPNNWDPRARRFLPNKVHTIEVSDLEGAVRAEVLIDRWGGHAGTTDKKLRFNGNDWLLLPEVSGTAGKPECYFSQDNPVIEVPLAHLRQGENTFEGIAGPQSCYEFGWSQWGLYALILRVYYPPSKGQPEGRIVSPRSGATITSDPVVKLSAKSKNGVSRVDVFARYEGYDENGDGRFDDWHHYYHFDDKGELALLGHVGSALAPPFDVRWDLSQIPDQRPRGISLVARIRDGTGLWRVTPVVSNLSLRRKAGSVTIHQCRDLPEFASVRMSVAKGCSVQIPSLAGATRAFVHLRTWNGLDGGHGSGSIQEPLQVNDWRGKMGGKDHAFAYTVIPVPVSALKEGTNKILFHSDESKEHGIDVLWPGPAIRIEYSKK
jgi:hypothetical protein